MPKKTKKRTPKKAPPKRRNTGSADWAAAFLAELRNTANIRASCEKAGVARSVAYQRKESDPQFAQAWADAIEDGVDALEQAARTRALLTSDTLLIFLLKSHRREVYGDKIDVRQTGPAEVTEVIVRTREQADAVLKLNEAIPATVPATG